MSSDPPSGNIAYPLGRSDTETRRLLLQGQLNAPITRRLLVEAGVGAGMRVLDVGTGAGDVALLAAELVGPSGRVVGIDANPAILETARERARVGGLSHVSFQVADVGGEVLRLGRDFDALVGRFVLLFQNDPVAVLRRLVSHLRPGGIVAFQEPDIARGSVSVPPVPTLDQVRGWLQPMAEHVGPNGEMGSRLYAVFQDAGLPPPQVRLQAVMGGGLDWPGYEVVAETLRSLLPRLVELGITTVEEANPDGLAARLGAEVASARGVVMLPPTVVAWSRKP